MKIRIPDGVADLWDRIGDVVNVPIYKRGRFEIRRIDIFLTLAGIFCVSWYGYTSGWRGAVLGGVAYLAMLATALWIR